MMSVGTLSAAGGAIDIGYFSITSDFFKRGYIVKFLVEPQDLGVGSFPVNYKFTIQPNGEVWMGSYFQITLPKEVEISDPRIIERKCDYNVTGFYSQSKQLMCEASDQVVTVRGGFIFQDTQNMTNDGDTFIPPTFSFVLPAFRNPRTTAPSSFFSLIIFDKNNQPLYTWDPKNTTLSLTNNGIPFTSKKTGIYLGPIVQVSQPAKPQQIVVTPESFTNGNTTNYEFRITPTNYVLNGDTINIQLPSQLKLSANSNCTGRTSNLMPEQLCQIVSFQEINITLKMPSSYGIGVNAFSFKEIQPSDPFKIVISGVQNPVTLMPTPSFSYFLYSNESSVEQQTTDIIVTMKNPGTMNSVLCNILPSNFIQSAVANYTLEFAPLNFQQQMKVVLTLPPKISLTSNKTNCYGLQGTDIINLDCQTFVQNKTILVKNAFTYQLVNPITVRIMFEAFTNPQENILTKSFQLQTMSVEGYTMDSAVTGLEVNFFCEYPCATCNKQSPTQCYSCYGGTSKYPFFLDFTCLNECPAGEVSTSTNNCTTCIAPCSTCFGSPTNCTSCIDGFSLVESYRLCRQIVYYPFPFFTTGFIFFIIILASEIKTKTESRFKEAFIALLAIPEVLCWCALSVLYYFKTGLLGAFTLAAAALFMYAVINFTHAIVHPRKMVPNSLYSYKILAEDYKHSTYFFRVISYLVSFKFSLILVSYLWLRPRFKGDYSKLNWMQFNKFSLIFIFMPYPTMMAACGYFLATDEFFTYAGFVTIEVIVISSISTFMMFLDAISVIKCKSIGKSQKSQAIKTATGLDYESDEDKPKGEEKKYRKKDGFDEFGADEGKSQGLHYEAFSADESKSQTHRSDATLIENNLGILKGKQRLTTQTKRQLAILEELARQMKEEKDHLRLEAEEIERERNQILTREPDTKSVVSIQNFVPQIQNLQRNSNPTSARQAQHRLHPQSPVTVDLQRNTYYDFKKADLFKKPDSVAESKQPAKLIEPPQMIEYAQPKRTPQKDPVDDIQTKMFSAKINGHINVGVTPRQPYKVIEVEMEDYEVVDRSSQADDSDMIEEAATMPQPSYGEINYVRQLAGDEHFWMQQITPRAGGDSMMGDYDVQDDGEECRCNRTALFDEGMRRPSVVNNEDFVFRDDASYSQINLTRQLDHSELYHQRSEAQMDILQRPTPIKSQQKFFQNEEAIFSNEDEREDKFDQENFVERQMAKFENLKDLVVKDGQDQFYFYTEPPAQGEAPGRRTYIDGGTEKYIKREDPAFEGNQTYLQREATPQQYFERGRPSAALASDHERQDFGDLEKFYHNVQASQGSMPVPKQKIATEMHFVQDQPNRNQIVSNHARNRSGNQKEKVIVAEVPFDRHPYQPALATSFARKGEVEKGFGVKQKLSFLQASAEFGNNGENSKVGESQDFIAVKNMREGSLAVGVAQQHSSLKSDAVFTQMTTKENYAHSIDPARDQIPSKEIIMADPSGHSDSSEAVVDHDPFNKGQRQSKQKKVKVVLYSDKSETSVEDYMDDTPSNYNIPNGKVDANSLGLKAILLQAQKHSEIAAGASNLVARQGSIYKTKKTTEAEELKFVTDLNRSRGSGWATMNQPVSSLRAPALDLSDGDTQKRKKTISTNKTFKEPPLTVKNQLQSKQDKNGGIQKNNFL